MYQDSSYQLQLFTQLRRMVILIILALLLVVLIQGKPVTAEQTPSSTQAPVTITLQQD